MGVDGGSMREAPVKSSRDCLTNVLNVSVKVFHHLIFPLLPSALSVTVSSDVPVTKLIIAASPQQQ